MSYGKKLRRARKSAGHTMGSFASYDVAHLSRIEVGDDPPDATFRRTVAWEIGRFEDWPIRDENRPEPVVLVLEDTNAKQS